MVLITPLSHKIKSDQQKDCWGCLWSIPDGPAGLWSITDRRVARKKCSKRVRSVPVTRNCSTRHCSLLLRQYFKNEVSLDRGSYLRFLVAPPHHNCWSNLELWYCTYKSFFYLINIPHFFQKRNERRVGLIDTRYVWNLVHLWISVHYEILLLEYIQFQTDYTTDLLLNFQQFVVN